MGRNRVAALKDVPTIAEAGFPKLVAERLEWPFLETGTPPAVTAQLNEAVNKALRTDKVRNALAHSAGAKCGLTSATRLPHALQINRGSRHPANGLPTSPANGCTGSRRNRSG